MVGSRYGRHIRAEAFSLPVPHISLLFVGIYLVIKVGICDMDFLGIDSDDGAVLFVQFAYLEDILAAVNAVVEELIPVQSLRDNVDGCLGIATFLPIG